MSTGQWAVVLRHVQRLFHGGNVSGLSEGQLLDRFVTTRDELAFGAIVARHGPMVLGVCRGVLDDPHDVEDAFQATFLVLVKKAALVRDRDLLGQWLYGVARRVSLRARSESRKRRAKERPEAEAAETAATLDADLRELQVLIREEVDRLSTHDRIAVVLCYLEGLTHEEAADQLGWPVGTVKGRLSRAREKLRGRLIRRGVTLPAAAIASTLAQGAKAAIPIDLIRSTTLAATSLAAGKTLTAGIVSAHAIALMEGVIGTMFLTKLKIGATALVATCVIAVPGVLAFQGPRPVDGAGKSSVQSPEKPSGRTVTQGGTVGKITPLDADPSRNQEARLAIEAMEKAEKAVMAGSKSSYQLEKIPVWSRRLIEARIGPDATEVDRKAALLAHRDRMRHLVELATELVKGEASGLTEFDVLEAKFRLLEAERWLRDGTIGATADRPAMGSGIGPGGGFPGGGGFNPSRFGGGNGLGAGGGVPPLRELVVFSRSPADEKQNDAIRAKLEEKIAMNFTRDCPLEEVKKYIEQATRDEAAGLPTGIPIYVDPQGLQDADKTMASTISIELQGIPLRTTLRLVLRQIGLDYRIDGGLLLISDEETIVVQELKASRAAPSAK